jgi:hypothetical protein
MFFPGNVVACDLSAPLQGTTTPGPTAARASTPGSKDAQPSSTPLATRLAQVAGARRALDLSAASAPLKATLKAKPLTSTPAPEAPTPTPDPSLTASPTPAPKAAAPAESSKAVAKPAGKAATPTPDPSVTGAQTHNWAPTPASPLTLCPLSLTLTLTLSLTLSLTRTPSPSLTLSLSLWPWAPPPAQGTP